MQSRLTKHFTHPLDVKQQQNLLPSNSRILDFGCGYGRFCSELTQMGYSDVVGVDSSLKMIQRGHQEHPEAKLHHSETLPTQLECSSFDAILLFAVLTCIPTDDGQLS